MPDLNDDQNADLDEFDNDLEGGSTDSGEGASADADDKSDKSDLKGEAKRIADLQSRADKAEARANKAEKALAAAAGQGSGTGSNDPAMQALMTELREASLDAVFGEYPELREYSIDRSLIEGVNRTEMRQSASALVSLIKNVATKARNSALADAGVKAEASGATRQKPKDYGAMSDEDFVKMLDSM